MDYGDEATVLVQSGSLLLRVSAASYGIDPTPVATEIMEAMLERV
jgi:hypothetical protein